MIAGRVDAEPGGEPDGLRRHFADWLEGGQELLARIARLGGELEQSRAAADAASREAARLAEDLASLQHENGELRAQSARLATDILRLRKASESLEAETETVRTQNAALLEERGQTAKLIADKLEDMLAQVLPRLSRPPAGLGEGAAAEPALPAVPGRAESPAVPAPADAPDAPGAAAFAAPAPAQPAPALSAATLTYVPAGEGLASEPGIAASDPPRPAAAPRVLIVDDESAFTKLLHDHLVGGGYGVLTAGSGEEALNALEIFAPRVVLLDMMMAGIGGMETLRRIKAARPDTSVIMITALDDRDVARRAVAAGASDYLTKPLSLDFLDSALAVHAAGPLPTVPALDAEGAARRTSFARA